MSYERKFSFLDVLIKSALYIYSLLVIFPLIWIVYTSLKTNREFVANPWALPVKPMFVNFVNAWTKVNFQTYAINSIMITLVAVVLTIVLAATTSYILVRFNFKLNKFILMLFISGLYVPIALILPPEFLLLRNLGLNNNRIGLIILYLVFSLPYSILVLSGFYRDLPKEFEESAYIDGSSQNRTFWQIIFPLSKNGVVAVAIFDFIWIWNDYIFALTFISDKDLRTLPVGLIGLMESFRLKADWVTLFAGLNLVMIPSIIIYFIFQKSLASGLASGAVKG